MSGHTKVNPAASYLRTKVMTAAPPELRLMLLDGALKFAGQGRDGLERRDFEASFEGISRCQQILVELVNALRPDHAPELCQRLSGLYTFMYTRLMEASRQRSPALVDEVIRLLAYERETWSMALQKLAGETASASPSPTREEPPPPATAGGTVSLKG
jgi:flagellar secretion chaperone FliS